MISVDVKVIHRAFGAGVITAVNGKYITVSFEIGEKSFVYPDAFEKFLTLEDGTVSEEIASDLTLAKTEKNKLKEKKAQENMHSMKHGIVIPGKETAPGGDEDEYKNSDSEDN